MSVTMRAPMPSIYHTPQSNSPASVHSPQDSLGRPMYGQHPQHIAYYPPYPFSQPAHYAHHAGSSPHPSLASHPPLSVSYQPGHAIRQQTMHPQTPVMDTSPRSKSSQTPLQRPISRMGPPSVTLGPMHGGPPASSNANQSAAPGPIPATTPLVIKQDDNGVRWISFEYSRDRVKVTYQIRCDVETVDTNTLSREHREANCVYPRACNKAEPYRGNRLIYETECNEVGWALAFLNPELRGKRGLIQRAVDSWRNSNNDQNLRSRRVRRLTKTTKRNHGHLNSQSGSSTAGTPVAAGATTTVQDLRQPGAIVASSHLHHHHMAPEGRTRSGDGDVSSMFHPHCSKFT